MKRPVIALKPSRSKKKNVDQALARFSSRKHLKKRMNA
jgi:hypothetical protein